MSLPKLTRIRKLNGQRPVLISAAAVTLSGLRNGNNAINRTTIAATQTLTLPSATGKRGSFRIEIGVTATGNKIIKAAGSDVFEGIASIAATTSGSFPTASNSNTITMSGTTLGGIAGSLVELIDVAAGKWQVVANLVGSGTAATPFSNT